MKTYIVFAEPDGMYLENIGGIEIFRPRISSELDIRKRAETHLRSKFSAGTYKNRDEINSIIQHQFKFFSNTLKELLPKVASRHFIEFLLYQYDHATEIESLYKKGSLNKSDETRWKDIEGRFRRAIKYMAERTIQLCPKENPQAEESSLLEIAEKVWICSEEMVKFYMISDQTYSILPDQSTLEILPIGEIQYYKHSIQKDFSDAQNRVNRDLHDRHRFVPEPSILFDLEEHQKTIGDPFKEKIGITYIEAISILRQLIQGANPPSEGFPIPFIHKGDTIKAVADTLNFPAASVERVLSGFTISKEQLDQEGREIWKPKQEYRAYRRGFFEFPHSYGTHLVFSKAMAQECLIGLIKETVFQHFPLEWRNGVIDSSLKKLSDMAGNWFENIVEKNFNEIDYHGIKSAKDGIGIGNNRIAIPGNIGDIDFIGYSRAERILIIAECKLVRDSFEPKLFRDDLSDFVNSKQAHAKKFRRKFRWVQHNCNNICEALASYGIYGTDIEPKSVAGIIVTFFPSVASYFIDDFPCVSLTELRLDHEDAQKWPYSDGIFSADSEDSNS